MAATHRKVIEYIADHTKVLKAIREIEQANERMGASLRRSFGRVTDVIGKDALKISQTRLIDPKTGQESIRAVENFGQTVKTSTGFVGTLNTTTTKLNGELRSSKTSFTESSKASASLTQNLANLAKRAALTIPIWLALRGAFMGSIRTIKDGISNIVEFDKALQKLKRNLQGTPQEIARNFQTAQRTITEFSLLTGKSTEEITRAIQRFATVGFDFETAMQAGLDATRLSVLLFGEAEETANAFARGLRALASNVEDTAKTQDEISRALALTSELWEVNAFELNELNGGFEKFAGTAKSMNFTIEETLTLLAALSTRGLNAERAGTLLRTSTQKLEQNLSKVARILGVEINPQMDRTFDVFVRVTNAIANLKSETGKISPAVSEAISELFGGVRGGEPIRDIIADMEKVNEAFTKFAKVRPDIVKFRKDFEDMNDTVFRQVEIMRNLNKETGKAFVTGVVGGEDFVDSLEKINSILSLIQRNANTVGTTLANAFRLARFDPTVLSDMFERASKEQGAIYDQFFELAKVAQRGLADGLSKAELEDTFNKLAKLRIKALTVGINLISPNFLTNLDKIEDTFIKIQTISSQTTKDSEQLTKNTKTLLDFELNRQKLNELILQNRLEQLKTQGFLNSEILKAEGLLKEQLGIQDTWEDALERQLAIEREINKEKRLQSQLSSETVKLFNIAQEHGIKVAERIGDVLAGEIDFSTFVRRGGEAVDIFKKEFADLFEQQQALAFFRGERVPGRPGLRGGERIAIEEEGLRRLISPFDALASLQVAKAQSATVSRLIRSEIKAQTTVKVDVEGLDFGEAAEKITNDVINELSKPESEFRRAINERIDKF